MTCSKRVESLRNCLIIVNKITVNGEQLRRRTVRLFFCAQKSEEIKCRRGPDARGLVGSRGKAPAEFEAEPHSATADQAVQIGNRRIAK